jgi:predicted permease
MTRNWIARLRARVRYRRFDADVREELEFHRAMSEADRLSEGIDAENARTGAARSLGNVLYQRENARAIWMGSMLQTLERLWKDLRHAGRRLSRAPIFTTFSILTLAVGIGVTTTVYAVVHAALGPPPGVPNIDRVVNVQHTRYGSLPMVSLSFPDYQDLARHQTVFDRIAAWSWAPGAVVGNARTAETIREAVTGDYFAVLGVGSQIGRVLRPSDDRPDAPPVAVVSDRLWQHLFDRDPSILGRSVKVDGQVFDVIGVAATDFHGSFQGGAIATGVWIPLTALRSMPTAGTSVSFDESDRRPRWLSVKARLAPGRYVEEAGQQVRAIGAQLDRSYPLGEDLPARFRAPYAVSRPWEVIPASSGRFDEQTNRVARFLLLGVLAAAGLVLLVACTNLSNLVLARWADRRHELAVRRALGASRLDVVRLVVVETLLIAGIGATLAIGTAWALTRIASTDIPVANGVALRIDAGLTPGALVAAFAGCLLVLLVAGVIPAWRVTRSDLRTVLAAEAATATVRWRGRRYLITLQVAVSVFLTAVAGLFVQQILRAVREDSGMELERLALAQIDFGRQQYEPDRARQIADAVVTMLAGRPDVTAASASTGLPAGLDTTVGGTARRPGTAGVRVAYVAATPGLPQILGLSITQGRGLDRSDTAGAASVALLSRAAADALFGKEPAIGQQIEVQRRRWAGEDDPPIDTRTVVGIVTDVKARPDRSDTGAVYLPLTQAYHSTIVVAARTEGNPETLVPVIREALRTVDPELGVKQVGTGQAVAGPNLLFFQIVGSLSASLGIFALGLALSGLYGVLSHLVTTRRREIGLRIALGASRSQIHGSILREGMSPVVLGLVAGLGLGWIGRRALQPAFERLVPAMDVGVAIVVSTFFILAGIVACYLPARRAARIDPNVALRQF